VRLVCRRYVILGMGPIFAGLFSFFFIFIMSYAAGTVIWWTLYLVQITLGAMLFFFAYQCGYLDTLFVKLAAKLAIEEDLTNSTNSSYALDTTDSKALGILNVAASANNFLETYAL
jgi:hypothetical protein